jgi:hypothetical protein
MSHSENNEPTPPIREQSSNQKPLLKTAVNLPTIKRRELTAAAKLAERESYRILIGLVRAKSSAFRKSLPLSHNLFATGRRCPPLTA